MKILTTAVFSLLMLRKKIILNQWVALILLVLGVVLVQLAQTESKDKSQADDKQGRFIGFLAAISACWLSGFAGVFFEKILKGASISVWMRNVQLSMCSIPFAIVTCAFNDFTAIQTKGFFFG